MALVDYQTIFCDGQVITATTYSDRSVDLQSLADYGKGKPWSVHCLIQGTHSNDLRVQVVGSTSPNFSDIVVVGDSGVIEKAKLVQGYDFYVDVGAVGKKYRYLALRFIPTIETTETVEGEEVTTSTATETVGEGSAGVDNIPHVLPVGAEPQAVANAIRAQIELLNNSNVDYPHANDQLAYATTQNV